MGVVFNESMSSLAENDYRDSVLYRLFYTRMCKKRKHLEPKCTNVFLMLVYDTSVNHMHLFIQFKSDIHPHQKFSKKRILSEHIKTAILWHRLPPEYLAPDPLGGNRMLNHPIYSKWINKANGFLRLICSSQMYQFKTCKTAFTANLN